MADDDYGTRSWLIDDDGFLTGIVYRQRWLPGENVATCRASFDEQIGYLGNSWTVRRPMDADEPGNPITPGHMIECGPAAGQGMGGRGFHGFLEGSNDYKTSSTASGVVALYGRGVRGARGGRFVKARIVAIWIRKYDFCGPYKQDVDRAHALRHLLMRDTLPPGCCEPNEASRVRYQKVRANYPGVPFYDTWDEMLRHHPTTAPLPPKETP